MMHILHENYITTTSKLKIPENSMPLGIHTWEDFYLENAFSN